MSLRRNEEPCCDPEVVFELADGALAPERRREVRAHVQACPGCGELYEKERNLNEFLGSLEFAEMRERSVCRGVAMALPTRRIAARLLWAALAAAMLVVSLAALGLDGTGPMISAASILGGLWGYVSGITEMLRTILAIAGSTVLIALAVGALVDLVIAAAVVSAARRT